MIQLGRKQKEDRNNKKKYKGDQGDLMSLQN